MRYIIVDKDEGELYTAESIDEAVETMLQIANDRYDGQSFTEWARIYDKLFVSVRDDLPYETL